MSKSRLYDFLKNGPVHANKHFEKMFAFSQGFGGNSIFPDSIFEELPYFDKWFKKVKMTNDQWKALHMLLLHFIDILIPHRHKKNYFGRKHCLIFFSLNIFTRKLSCVMRAIAETKLFNNLSNTTQWMHSLKWLFNECCLLTIHF